MFAQVTVALIADENERVRAPELFLNDRRVERPTKDECALLESAVAVVREEEAARGIPMCVTRVESSYVDAHPEAARLAALSAVAALITK